MALTVLTYNIQEGGGDRLPALARVIARCRPDAVALLEATSRPNAAWLARALSMMLVVGEANNGVHVAWLSRTPVRRQQNHRRPGLAKTLLEIEQDAPSLPLRLFATHLASRHDVQTPVEEIKDILEVLAPLAAAPHLLVGDFNALCPGDSVGEPPSGVRARGDAAAGAPRLALRPLLAAGYLDCYRAAAGALPGYTYPAAAPCLRLDCVFASPALAARLTGCGVIDDETAVTASDHLPVWATFA